MAARKRSRRWWRRVVRRYEEERGSTTLRAFAEREGLVYGTFSWWVHQFRREGREKAKPKPVSLLPVRVVEDGQADQVPAPAERWLEAEFPDGLQLRFCEGTGAEYVSQLVSGLRRGSAC